MSTPNIKTPFTTCIKHIPNKTPKKATSVVHDVNMVTKIHSFIQSAINNDKLQEVEIEYGTHKYTFPIGTSVIAMPSGERSIHVECNKTVFTIVDRIQHIIRKVQNVPSVAGQFNITVKEDSARHQDNHHCRYLITGDETRIILPILMTFAYKYDNMEGLV